MFPRSFIPTLVTLLSLVSLSHAQHDSVVVFNEIHFHPTEADTEDLEFIELYNQCSVRVDLSNWSIDGIDEFRFAEGTVIEPQSYLVIAKNPEALEAATGFADALGPFPGVLSNSGESLILRNHNDRSMDVLDYLDISPWPLGADGSGATLSKRLPHTATGEVSNWSASRNLNGTPGAPNLTWDSRPSLHFSEVEAAPMNEESPFWIELHYSGTSTLDLTDFELRDSGGASYAFSEGASLASDQFLVIPRTELSSFSVEAGDRLYLVNAITGELFDSLLVLTTPRARFTHSQDPRFYFPTELTPSAVNDITLRDEIVINEIMYHHRPQYEDPDDASSPYLEIAEEWIEIYNRSANSVDLSGWRFTTGIDYEFPSGTMLDANAYLVISNDANALQAKFSGIDIVGNFDGALNNGSDTLELQESNGNPVDLLRYYDGSPWPDAADAGGSSLELINPLIDNSRPEAWAASDEARNSEWHTYTYRATAVRPVYTATVGNFHEMRVGLLQAGSCLIDNVSIVENPDGAQTELIRNRTFGSLFAPISAGNWRFLGTHEDSDAINDPEMGSVLKLVANGSMNYLNNLCEGDLNKAVETGREYEVSFDAKWLSGSPQLRTEVYYNKIAKKTILKMPEKHGTPGQQNSMYAENVGPTFADLLHQPAVPSPNEPIRISVAAADPNGVADVSLHYSVNNGDWNATNMESVEAGFEATLTGENRGSIISFYVEATDTDGFTSRYPQKDALLQVDNPIPGGPRQPLRLIVHPSDASALHLAIDILNNSRKNCTIISNERDIHYNCGVRLRGSMFSRSGGAESGLNLKFPADKPFRGVQPTITVRKRNVHEILVKHLANQAGNVPESYNDFVELRGYLAGHTGVARMEMARFGGLYMDGAFEDGGDQPLYKMEGIRDFQQTNAAGVKLPQPVGWIQTFDFADLGDDHEQYRHSIRLNENVRVDNYAPIVQMCKAFSEPTAELREAVEQIIDVDQWARMMAMQTLCGIADVYPIENPHNFNVYLRPTDQKFIAIPWDWDFTFNLGANAPIIDPQSSRKNLWRILSLPGIRRLYEGHLLDLIDTVFNQNYVTPWFEHYQQVAGGNYSSFINYVGARGNAVRNQITTGAIFHITSNDGDDFSTDAHEVVIEGLGPVRLRTIRVAETGNEYQPQWIDDTRWRLTLPLQPGENILTLHALDYQGSAGSLFNPMGNDIIRITNTGTVAAANANSLVISEIMYHPADPSAAEAAAGFSDGEAFEFLELVNVSETVIDLASLSFISGITFDFAAASKTTLAPNEVALLVSNQNAFELRYGEGLPIVGTYEGQLSNSGESLSLAGIGNQTLYDFSYSDSAPWPDSADGDGYSLSLNDFSDERDLALPSTWKPSTDVQGTPGRLESTEPPTGLDNDAWLEQHFDAETIEAGLITGFSDDPDNDGWVNLAEFVFGGNPVMSDTKDPAALMVTEVSDAPKEGTLLIRHHKRRDIIGVDIEIEFSDNLQAWDSVPESELELISRTVIDEDTEQLSWSWTAPASAATGYIRLAVSPE